jgi:hypothetical protein
MVNKESREFRFAVGALVFAVLLAISTLSGHETLTNLFGLLVAGVCAEISHLD